MRTGPIMRALSVRAAWLAFLFLGLLVLLLIPFLPGSSEAAPCTPGVDCYCDRVKGGNLNDPNVLVCEDFDADAYHLDVGNVPNGSWYSDAGFPGNRGFGSLWRARYGNTTQGSNWYSGQPANPQRGTSCAFPQCSGGPVYDELDRWGGNNYSANIFIVTPGKFNVEIPTLTNPTNTAGGGSGVFDGNASMAWRNPPVNSAGTGSGKSFGALHRTFGVTQAVAYPTNSDASQIWKAPWKHHEFAPVVGASPGHGLVMFHNQGFRSNADPFFYMFIGNPVAGETQASCNAKIAAAKAAGLLPFGTALCDSTPALLYGAGSNYNRTTHWPDGMWGCVRAHFENMGLVNSRIRIWLTTAVVTDLPIVDLTMDLRKTGAVNGYGGLFWDHYANANSPGFVGGPIVQTTYRYEDNVHIRAGAPVSCTQIGFGGGSQGGGGATQTVGPSAPTGVQIR